MPEPPAHHVHINIHGACLVCLEHVRDSDDIKLVKEDGHYAAFAEDGTLVWADAVYAWVHLAHTN